MSHELEVAISNTREWIQNEIANAPEFEASLVRRGYLAELFAFSDWRGNRPLSKEVIDEYRSMLQRSGYSPVSVKRALAAIGWWLERILQISSPDEEPDEASKEQIRALIALLRSSPSPRPPSPSSSKRISKAQLQTIMKVCADDASPLGLRDGAIVALLWATGISYTSLTRSTIFDIRSEESGGQKLSFRWKDRQERIVDLPATASELLAKWVGLRGMNLGPLFYEVKGTDRIQWGHGITKASVKRMLWSRLEQARSLAGPSQPASER